MALTVLVALLPRARWWARRARGWRAWTPRGCRPRKARLAAAPASYSVRAWCDGAEVAVRWTTRAPTSCTRLSSSRRRRGRPGAAWWAGRASGWPTWTPRRFRARGRGCLWLYRVSPRDDGRLGRGGVTDAGRGAGWRLADPLGVRAEVPGVVDAPSPLPSPRGVAPESDARDRAQVGAGRPRRPSSFRCTWCCSTWCCSAPGGSRWPRAVGAAPLRGLSRRNAAARPRAPRRRARAVRAPRAHPSGARR